MNVNKSVQKAKEQGIVHFWDLPEGNRVILNAGAKDKLIRLVKEKYNSNAKASLAAGIGKTTLNRYIQQRGYKVTIDVLLKICKIVDSSLPFLNELEKNIVWAGFANSQGIINPKLPFNFNSREGARFLAAICNDGWISDGAYYSYSEQDLAYSVKTDTLSVFGGNTDTVTEGRKDNDKYLVFPSIIRDVLVIVTSFKGIKSENNPAVPKFVFKDIEYVLGWIEQTIADEGYVKYKPEENRREVIWKRAFKKDLQKYNLNINEIRMLDTLGIRCRIYNGESYNTAKGVEKTSIIIRIAGRENLLKLRKLIKIPCRRKDKIFTTALLEYKRHKEPLRIKDNILEICNEKSYITNSDLKNVMGYKKVNTAIRWLRYYSKIGLIKRTSESFYGTGVRGRAPAKYALNI